MSLIEIEPYLENFETFCLECDFYRNPCDCLCEYEEKNEKGGGCHIFDCPYCSPASFADLKKYDPDLYEEWKGETIGEYTEEELLDEENPPAPEDCGCPWVVVYFKEETCS